MKAPAWSSGRGAVSWATVGAQTRVARRRRRHRDVRGQAARRPPTATAPRSPARCRRWSLPGRSTAASTTAGERRARHERRPYRSSCSRTGSAQVAVRAAAREPASRGYAKVAALTFPLRAATALWHRRLRQPTRGPELRHRLGAEAVAAKTGRWPAWWTPRDRRGRAPNGAVTTWGLIGKNGGA